jgi:hypothetical protein
MIPGDFNVWVFQTWGENDALRKTPARIRRLVFYAWAAAA